MVRWLFAATIVTLLISSAASAQNRAAGALKIAQIARNRTIDLRISPMEDWPGRDQLEASMLVHQDLAPNTSVGAGLARMYQGRRTGAYRAGDAPHQVRDPAVTFRLKF